MEKLNTFISELGKKYDGNKNIAYIDIRSYGNYGEQNLGNLGGEEITNEQLIELFIKPYKKVFSDTMLVNPYGNTKFDDVYNWSVQNGISIRSDGILYGNSKKATGKVCLKSYGILPSIFEYGATYEQLKEKECWSEERLLNTINTGKPSYLQLDTSMYSENMDIIRKVANKIGYYFKFKGSEYTNRTSTIEDTDIKLKFINEGVAPLYEPCTVYIGLLDKGYNLVKKYKTEIDPHNWMPNEEIEENIKLKLEDIDDGKYIISLGLFLNENDEKPTYLLGNSGKTDDNWYIFGEITISNPQEEYNIKIQNEQTIINRNNDYNINISMNNIRKNSEYSVNILVNNQNVQKLNIDNTQKEYNKNININFANGSNAYKIQIEKNGQVVIEKEQNIYVVEYMEDTKQVTSEINNKYNEFLQKYENEIQQINNLQNEIKSIQKYVEINSNISESMAFNIMEQNYKIVESFIQKYENNLLEEQKLDDILKDIGKIGDLIQNLVIINTSNKIQFNDEQINNEIQENIYFLNENSDIVPEYIKSAIENNLNIYKEVSEIEQIQTNITVRVGLINSKLKGMELTASLNNKLINACIEKYIINNPVTIEYSETGLTNKDVKATLKTNANIEITNNNGKNEYTFITNGIFEFEYKVRGKEFSIIAKVDNIDKEAPIITEVQDGKIYTDSVTPKITDKNLDIIELKLNGEKIEKYTTNTILTEEGFYEIIAKDKAENISNIKFQIIVNYDNRYRIEKNIIKNISGNTTKSEFDEKINLNIKYKILRNEKEIGTDDKIATGDILETQVGDRYTLIVTGDINKDGQVNIKDFIKMKIYLLDSNNLDETEKIAADCDLDGKKIGVKDYIRLRLIILMNM